MVDHLAANSRTIMKDHFCCHIQAHLKHPLELAGDLTFSRYTDFCSSWTHAYNHLLDQLA